MKYFRVLLLTGVIAALLLYALAQQKVVVEVSAHSLKESFVSLYFDAPTADEYDAVKPSVHRLGRAEELDRREKGALGSSRTSDHLSPSMVTPVPRSASEHSATSEALWPLTHTLVPRSASEHSVTSEDLLLSTHTPATRTDLEHLVGRASSLHVRAAYPITPQIYCDGVTARRACRHWYQQRDLGSPSAGKAAISCASSCHGRGTCDKTTGLCACEAGYNGTACEGINVRKCNGETDGMWVASHCAGECDETRGWCWCPGKVGDRPMVETCQVKHMPLEVFASLGLSPDPQARRYNPHTGEEIDPMGPGRIPARDEARHRKFLEMRKELTADLRKRAEIVRSFWYGTPKSHPEGRNDRPLVTVSENGIPHTVNSSHATAAPIVAPAKLTSEAHGWYQKLAARGTHKYSELLVSSKIDSSSPAWCEAAAGGPKPSHTCACVYDGMHGELCEQRHEAFCLNQCSGHGQCSAFGGACKCNSGYFGIDCSLTTSKGGHGGEEKVILHEGHAARRAPRRPYIYVYDVPEHTSLILQYRAQAYMCTHRVFSTTNKTIFPSGYAYTVEIALHEWLLRSPHRTASGADADFFYVPLYTACAILPVYDYVGPGPFAHGYPMRPVTAMRMVSDAVELISKVLPYWNVKHGKDHIFLLAHDEGGCWAPKVVAENSIILTHWGRKDEHPSSSSRYMADNWSANWRADTRAPSGKRWHFPNGSRDMIGDHPCYVAAKDLVIPVFAPPSHWSSTPWLSAIDTPERSIFAYFSGNLAEREPTKYSRGIRHRMLKAFRHTTGWKLVGNRGGRYSADLARSEFCIVPPGGDGWSSRVDDSVRHGCIPVIIMDNVHMPFESVLDYSLFSVRVLEKDVEQTDAILRNISLSARVRMRNQMKKIWLRFTYAQAFLEPSKFAPGLPQNHLDDAPLPALQNVIAPLGHGPPDAFDTLMMALYARLLGWYSSSFPSHANARRKEN